MRNCKEDVIHYPIDKVWLESDRNIDISSILYRLWYPVEERMGITHRRKAVFGWICHIGIVK